MSFSKKSNKTYKDFKTFSLFSKVVIPLTIYLKNLSNLYGAYLMRFIAKFILKFLINIKLKQKLYHSLSFKYKIRPLN